MCQHILRLSVDHIAEQKRQTEEFLTSLKACSDNFKEAKRLIKEQHTKDTDEEKVGVLRHDSKYQYLQMQEDVELLPYLQERIKIWEHRHRVAVERAEHNSSELQRRINDVEVMLFQLDSDDPNHALKPLQLAQPGRQPKTNNEDRDDKPKLPFS